MDLSVIVFHNNLFINYVLDWRADISIWTGSINISKKKCVFRLWKVKRLCCIWTQNYTFLHKYYSLGQFLFPWTVYILLVLCGYVNSLNFELLRNIPYWYLILKAYIPWSTLNVWRRKTNSFKILKPKYCLA
jgi:hypothetical protein